MSTSNLMDTAPGGEGDNYEDVIATTQVPHSKSSGQFSSSSATSTQAPTSKAGLTSDAENADKAAHTAEKIRYGQAISEGGMGGKTTGLSSSTEAENVDAGSATGNAGAGSREAAGYAGENNMDQNIGA